MIVEAFNRQVSVDPARTSLYLRCLKSIATLRGGADWEIIDQAVQLAYSEGKYTDEDVTDAYKYFGLNGDDPNLTEDIIIKTFYVFIGSTAQGQETEARQRLWRIGHSRRSERIQSASEDRESIHHHLLRISPTVFPRRIQCRASTDLPWGRRSNPG